MLRIRCSDFRFFFCGTAQIFRPEQLHGDRGGGKEECHRAGHPHDHPGACLVFQRTKADNARSIFVGRIKNAIVEREESRQSGVLEIGEQKVGNHGPAGPVWPAGPGLDDVPPKHQGRGEEAEVFDLVPAIGSQREFVEMGHMPENVAQSEKQPTHGGMHDRVNHVEQTLPLQKGTEPLGDELAGQSAQHGQLGSTEPDEARRHHGQQKMLHHVRDQEKRGKGVERGGERNIEGGQTAQEAEEPPDRIARRHLTVEFSPAAGIDEGGEKKTEGRQRLESPGGKRGGLGVHRDEE